MSFIPEISGSVLEKNLLIIMSNVSLNRQGVLGLCCPEKVSQIDKRFFPTVAKTITGAVNEPLDVVEGWVGHGIGCYYSGKVN